MVRSHTHELLASPRPRSTCDRCHLQKLRCMKSENQPICLRCSKHGTSCIFSVRTKRRIRDARETNAPEEATSLMASPGCLSVENSDLALPDLSHIYPPIHNDTWAMDFNNLFAADSRDPISAATSIQARENRIPTSLDLVRELGNMNVQLYDHFCTLPTTSSPSDSDSRPASDPRSPGSFAIDETFTLTNTFITLLQQLRLSLNNPANAGASMDHATTLLILSCFHRLMDIYGFIAISVQECSRNPHMPLPGEQPLVTLPPLQVGSYQPPQLQRDKAEEPATLSTVSMHMMVILTLSSQLCRQLYEIITSGLEVFDTEVSYGFFSAAASAETHISDTLAQRLSLFSNPQARVDIEQRWNVLTEQFQAAKQAVIMFSASLM